LKQLNSGRGLRAKMLAVAIAKHADEIRLRGSAKMRDSSIVKTGIGPVSSPNARAASIR
jgi:hypothetical protein